MKLHRQHIYTYSVCWTYTAIFHHSHIHIQCALFEKFHRIFHLFNILEWSVFDDTAFTVTAHHYTHCAGFGEMVCGMVHLFGLVPLKGFCHTTIYPIFLGFTAWSQKPIQTQMVNSNVKTIAIVDEPAQFRLFRKIPKYYGLFRFTRI